MASVRVARRLVAGVVAAEALGVAAWAAYLGVETLVSTPADRLGSAFLVLVALAVAVGLAAVARGVLTGRRWARAPTVVWQAIQALIGLQFAQGAATTPQVRWQWAIAVPLVAAGLLAGIGVLRPGVIEDDREF